MITRRAFLAAKRLPRPSIAVQRPVTASFSALQHLRATSAPDEADPDFVYQNPPRIKRENRDPYADWWDKQERRNFGEPLHEDNDILGRFSLHEYTHMTSGRAGLLWLGFISLVTGLYFTVKAYAPGKPGVPQEYADGLDAELGGAGALRARKAGDSL